MTPGERGAGELAERALAPQILRQLLAVLDEMDAVGEPALVERLLDQQAVLGVVVGDQDGDRGRAPSPGAGGSCRCATGSVKTKVAPRPGLPDALIVPPWRSTILRQMASPMPVPS